MTTSKFTKQKGFTLIELMVVILIIAILGALGMVSYSQANRSARDGKRRADIEAVRQALLLRRQETGSYYVLGTTATATNFNNSMSNLVSTGYLSPPAPLDPQNSTRVYTMSGNASGTTFCICADVENDNGNSSSINCNFVSTPNTGTHYCARQP